MPKEPPPAEMSHFVLAMKTDTGERLEYSGKAPTGDVLKALRFMQEAAIAAKNAAMSPQEKEEGK